MIHIVTTEIITRTTSCKQYDRFHFAKNKITEKKKKFFKLKEEQTNRKKATQNIIYDL